MGLGEVQEKKPREWQTRLTFRKSLCEFSSKLLQVSGTVFTSVLKKIRPQYTGWWGCPFEVVHCDENAYLLLGLE